MRPFLLLISVPLAVGSCPQILEGIDDSMFDRLNYDMRDAVSTACGRTMRIEVFWSPSLPQRAMNYLARDDIRNDGKLCSEVCAEYLDRKYHARAFAPLARSLRNEMRKMDNAEAKAVIDRWYNHSLKYRLEDRDDTWVFTHPSEEHSAWYDLWMTSATKASDEADLALALAMRRAFGIEDDFASNTKRITTAMNALKNAKSPRDDEEIASLIGLLQKVMKDNYFSYFAQQIRWYRGGGEWIRPIEVLPAIEILYIQYRSIKNAEAKKFVDEFLTSWREQYERHEAILTSKAVNAKNENTAFDNLSPETTSALEAAFPELIMYLYKNGYIGMKNHQII